MPTTSSMYNNPAIGQAASNIAQMFAPPSGADIAGYAGAAATRAKAARDAEVWARATAPGATPQSIDLPAIGAGDYTPLQSFYAQNQNNATALAKQANDLKLGEEQIIAQPQSAGASSTLPPELANAFNVPSQRTGNIAVAPGEQVTPAFGGPVIKGQPQPMIVPDPMNAGQFKYATPDQAIGQPAPPPPGSPQAAYANATTLDAAANEKNIDAGAIKAQNTLSALGAMKADLADPGFYSGPLANQVMVAKQAAAAIGIDPNGVSSMEDFNAKGNQTVKDLLGSLGQGVSNTDLKYAAKTIPNLSNSKEGNLKLLDYQMRLAQRQVDVANWAHQYKQAHGGQLDANWGAYEQQQADAHPLFPEATAAAGAPAVGTVSKGYVFQGGDPSVSSNWAPAPGST